MFLLLTNHLLQDASIVIIEIDWSHFTLHFVELNARAITNAIGTPKVSIRSIPKLLILKPIRQEFNSFEFWTLQMTETGLFVVCDPVHLLPEESTPKGKFSLFIHKNRLGADEKSDCLTKEVQPLSVSILC